MIEISRDDFEVFRALLVRDKIKLLERGRYKTAQQLEEDTQRFDKAKTDARYGVEVSTERLDRRKSNE